MRNWKEDQKKRGGNDKTETPKRVEVREKTILKRDENERAIGDVEKKVRNE